MAKLSDKARENVKMAASYDADKIEAAFAAGDFGDLLDAETGDYLRKATKDEAIESYESGIDGGIVVDGKTCYVEPV